MTDGANEKSLSFVCRRQICRHDLQTGEMMNELINRLVLLGITEQEASIYIVLLQKQSQTVSELAKIAHTNRTQTYDIIARLTKRGMVEETLGSVKKYSAVHPATVMQQFRETLTQAQKNIDLLSPSLEELYSRKDEEGDPIDFIKVLRTSSSINDNVMMLVKEAKQSVLVFNKPPYAMKPDENPDEEKSIHRGVRHMCVYEDEPQTRQAFLRKLQRFAAVGEEIRIVPNLPMKVILIDDTHAVFTLHHRGLQSTNFTAMTIEHSDLVLLLKRTFMLYWNEGITFEEYKNGGIKCKKK